MKKFTQIFALALLVTIARAKISVLNPIPPATVLFEDNYVYNVSLAFNLSDANGPVDVTPSIGGLTAPGPIQTKNLSRYPIENLYLVEQVEQNIAAFVFDQNKVILEVLDHNGKYMFTTNLIDLSKPSHGKEQVCTGFAYNEKRAFLYIGCYEEITEENQATLLTIFTYDFNAGVVVGEETVLQLDGFVIAGRLQMFIANAPQDSFSKGLQAAEDNYLVVYDQINTEIFERDDTTKFRVFRNVDYRKLRYYYTGGVALASDGLQVVYGFFNYFSNIVVTGRANSDPENIQVFSCKLNNGDKRLECAGPKNIGISQGYIGLQENNRLIGVDTQLNYVTVWAIPADWTDPTWGTDVLEAHFQANLFRPKLAVRPWIRKVTYSTGGAVLQYDSNLYLEYGSVVVDWYRKSSTKFRAFTGFAYQNSYVLGDQTENTVSLYSLGEPAIFNTGQQRPIGLFNLTVEAQDEDDKVTNTGTINEIDTLFLNVSLQNDNSLSVFGNTKANFQLTQEITSGNGLLSITATSKDNNTLGIIDSWIHRQAIVKIDGADLPIGDTFFGGEVVATEYYGNDQGTQTLKASPAQALTQSPGNRKFVKIGRYLGAQKTEDPNTVQLNFQSIKEDTTEIAESAVLSREISSLGNFREVLYTTDFAKTQTTIFITSLTGVHKQYVNAYALDIKAELGGPKKGTNENYIHITLALQDQVQLWRVDPEDLTDWILVTTLTAKSFGLDRFCPVSLSINYKFGSIIPPFFDPRKKPIDYRFEKDANNKFFIERNFVILSTCQRNAQITNENTVFRMNIDGVPYLEYLPLSSIDLPRVACSLGSEVFIGGNFRAYGVNDIDDFSLTVASLYLLEIDFEFFNTHCVDAAGAAVVYGRSLNSPDDGSWNMAVVRGQELRHQDRRYPVVLRFEAERLTNHELKGTIMTTIYQTNGNVIFYQSSTYPVVEYKTADVTADTNVTMTLSVTNSINTTTLDINVQIQPEPKPSSPHGEQEEETSGMKRLFSRLF